MVMLKFAERLMPLHGCLDGGNEGEFPCILQHVAIVRYLPHPFHNIFFIMASKKDDGDIPELQYIPGSFVAPHARAQQQVHQHKIHGIGPLQCFDCLFP